VRARDIISIYIIILYTLCVYSYTLFWIPTTQHYEHFVPSAWHFYAIYNLTFVKIIIFVQIYVYIHTYYIYGSRCACSIPTTVDAVLCDWNLISFYNNNIVSTTPYRAGVTTRWHIVRWRDETSACEANLFDILRAATVQTMIVRLPVSCSRT